MPPLGWIYLPVAFLLGALHALEPGHGKSLASAYLISGKHDWKDAMVLGVATTLSHTSVVILLALASLSLKDLVEGPKLERGIALFGGCLLAGLGVWTAGNSLRQLRHGHAHQHGHSHGHGHAAPSRGGFWGVAIVGLSNGVLPCPGALAALLVALSLGQMALGLATVFSYSLGLASALVAMGILVVEAGKRVRAWLPSERAMLYFPLASGCLVFGTGVWILLK
jgi:ABC-type nickel/cobalt efflux system permease component RcnA